MRSIRTLIGLPVIVNRRRAGRVVRAELSEDLTRLSGIWISSGFFGMRFISSENIGTLGAVAVTADHSGSRRKFVSEPFLKRAIGTDGSLIGAITGADIDELSFQVDALELSCGLWDDLLRGRKRIRNFVMNQDKAYVIIGLSEMEKEERR